MAYISPSVASGFLADNDHWRELLARDQKLAELRSRPIFDGYDLGSPEIEKLKETNPNLVNNFIDSQCALDDAQANLERYQDIALLQREPHVESIRAAQIAIDDANNVLDEFLESDGYISARQTSRDADFAVDIAELNLERATNLGEEQATLDELQATLDELQATLDAAQVAKNEASETFVPFIIERARLERVLTEARESLDEINAVLEPFEQARRNQQADVEAKQKIRNELLDTILDFLLDELRAEIAAIEESGTASSYLEKASIRLDGIVFKSDSTSTIFPRYSYIRKSPNSNPATGRLARACAKLAFAYASGNVREDEITLADLPVKNKEIELPGLSESVRDRYFSIIQDAPDIPLEIQSLIAPLAAYVHPEFKKRSQAKPIKFVSEYA